MKKYDEMDREELIGELKRKRKWELINTWTRVVFTLIVFIIILFGIWGLS